MNEMPVTPDDVFPDGPLTSWESYRLPQLIKKINKRLQKNRIKLQRGTLIVVARLSISASTKLPYLIVEMYKRAGWYSHYDSSMGDIRIGIRPKN